MKSSGKALKILSFMLLLIGFGISIFLGYQLSYNDTTLFLIIVGIGFFSSIFVCTSLYSVGEFVESTKTIADNSKILSEKVTKLAFDLNEMKIIITNMTSSESKFNANSL